MDPKRLLSVLIALLLLVGSASIVTARGDDAPDTDEVDEGAGSNDDPDDVAEEDDVTEEADEVEDADHEDGVDDADEAEAELDDCDEQVVDGTFVCEDEDEDDGDELEQEDCSEETVNGTLVCDDDHRSGRDSDDETDEDRHGSDDCVKTEVEYEDEYVDPNGTEVKEKYELKTRDCEDDAKDRFEERVSAEYRNTTAKALYEFRAKERGVEAPDAASDDGGDARSEVKVKAEEKRSDTLGQQVRKVVFEAKLQASKPIDALRALFASWFG